LLGKKIIERVNDFFSPKTATLAYARERHHRIRKGESNVILLLLGDEKLATKL